MQHWVVNPHPNQQAHAWFNHPGAITNFRGFSLSIQTSHDGAYTVGDQHGHRHNHDHDPDRDTHTSDGD
jgi:hypothetical protein